MTTGRQRWGHRRALTRQADVSELTDADCAATVYAVTYHGEQTRTQILVLAADEQQAKEFAALRWKFIGDALEPSAVLSAEPRNFCSGEIKAAILTFESPDEWDVRNARGTAA